MNYDDGLFDLRQVEAITSDLRMLCQDLADRLHKSDPGAALEFADNLVTRKISADTFVELFRDNIVGRLDPDKSLKTVRAENGMRRSH
jgi:hypothetical protein